jgi:hypothetical protein
VFGDARCEMGISSATATQVNFVSPDAVTIDRIGN